VSRLQETDDADPVTECPQTVEYSPIGDIETGRRIGDGNERRNQDQVHFATHHEWNRAIH
jgi:hypothetical protein